MAVLKAHMLHDIATSLFTREQHYDGWRPLNVVQRVNASIERFVLAGKGPSRIFRRIVENDVTLTSVGPVRIELKYRGKAWRTNHSFLNTVFTRWTRKLSMSSFRLSAGKGFSKILSENRNIEELRISNRMLNKWSVIQKMFPNLTTLGFSSSEFSKMLLDGPTKLHFLKEIELTSSMADFLNAHKTFCEHQNKWPNLDTIRYLDTRLWWVRECIRKLKGSISTIKHVEINTDADCSQLDFSILTDMQKLFPSLESIEIGADVRCKCGNHNAMAQKIECLDRFFKAFHSLSSGLFIKFNYREGGWFNRSNADTLYQFICTKASRVYGNPKNITAKTWFPGKELIYKFSS